MGRRKRKKIEVRKKEFRYRGYRLDQLRAMALTELLPLLPASARRKLNRGMSEEAKKVLERAKRKDYLRTHRRDLVVLPQLVGKKIGIYNGKEFETIAVKPEMIGHYLGEFTLTRKKVKHTGPGVGATKSSKYLPLK